MDTATKKQTDNATPEQKRTRAELEELAANSSMGTGRYYRHPLPGSVVYTDGARGLAEITGSHWFIDLIASWQYEPEKIPDTAFQSWKIEMTGPDSCRITCSDGNDDRRTMQEVPFTDYPLPEGAELWAIPTGTENGRRVLVILHPREY